jgi:hypothetical protein
MELNPYESPRETNQPPKLPKPQQPLFAWINYPFHPYTLAIAGAILLPLLLAIIAALLFDA